MTNSFVLTRWLLAGMRWLYESIVSFTGMQASYAIVLTILLFTVAIRCLTVFGDIKSRKSSMQMQEIQPDLDRLMKKYQNDPKRMNQERNKLMKEKGVSTMSGCLPLLIMMPLLFMFINAFRAWSNEQMLSLMLTMDKDPQAGINLFSQYKFFWILNIWRPDNLTSSAVLTGEQFWRTFAATKATYIDKFIFYTEHQQALDELLLRMGFFVKDAAGETAVMTLQLNITNTDLPPTLSEISQTAYEGLPIEWSWFDVSDPDREDTDDNLRLCFQSRHAEFYGNDGKKLDAADLDYELDLKVNKPLTIDRSMPLMAFIPVDLLDRR